MWDPYYAPCCPETVDRFTFRDENERAVKQKKSHHAVVHFGGFVPGWTDTERGDRVDLAQKRGQACSFLL
jgi:hypothetical protein